MEMGRVYGMHGCGNKLIYSLVGSLEEKRELRRPLRR
jgi:hypothetical protein